MTEPKTEEIEIVNAGTGAVAMTLSLARASAHERFPWEPAELDFAFPAPPGELELRSPFLATRCEVAPVRRRLIRALG